MQARFYRPRPENLEAQLRQYARTIVDVQKWPQFQRIVKLLDRSAQAFPDLARDWDEIVTRRAVDALAHDMAAVDGASVDWDFYAKLFHFAVSGWHRAESNRRPVRDEETIAFADQVIDVILASMRSPNV